VIGLRYGVVSELGNRVAMVTCSDSVIVGLQIDVITVLGSLADRFAQACICTAIIGNRHGNAPFRLSPSTVRCPKRVVVFSFNEGSSIPN
jgi:hypothetical protein